MFDPKSFLSTVEKNQLSMLKHQNWDEKPQFLDADLARQALGRLVRRIMVALDERLIEDPADVGFAAGAMIELASHMCQDAEAADYYANSWLDYDFPGLEAFLLGGKEALKHV